MAKASDNLFPSVLLAEQGSTPASPSAGNQRVFLKTSDHLAYLVNSSGTVTALGGGASGALTLITDTIVGVAVATIDFTSIPGTYKHLRLVLQARGTDAAQQGLRVVINNDTGANYDWSFIRNAATTPGANTSVAAGITTHGLLIDGVSSSSDTAGVAAAGTFDVPRYAGTTLFKAITGTGFRPVSGNVLYEQASAVQWRSTSAITRITLSLDAGNFDVGSSCGLYGIS